MANIAPRNIPRFVMAGLAPAIHVDPQTKSGGDEKERNSANPGTTLIVSDMGILARRALAAGAMGRVGAVFERSFYIDLAGRWLCLSALNAPGPLFARFDPAKLGAVDIRGQISVGDAVEVGETSFRIDGRFEFSTGTARTWAPLPLSAWTQDSLARGLAGLRHIAGERIPREGLGGFILGIEAAEPISREARMAAGAVAELGDWLGAALSTADPAAPPLSLASLIGLGPGLTPSGDDFLAGVMIAAHALARPRVAERLYAKMAPNLARLTHPISAAHLEAAAEGLGSGKLHEILDTILAGHLKRLPGDLAGLAAIGHSSGWDALAGMVLALANFDGRGTILRQ